jgi:hypothetical protein
LPGRSGTFATARSASRRRPRGYLGRQHETLGSDILAVYRILKLPEQVLGASEVRRLQAIVPDHWYPIEWLLELMDKIDETLGSYGLLRMGRMQFDLSHKDRVLQKARSARDILHGVDEMYRHSNRGGAIGGWKVLRFDPGYAELEKTTPHHCVMEQGMLSAGLAAVGCPGSVTQTECLREGADVCVYIVTSSLIDERWAPPA